MRYFFVTYKYIHPNASDLEKLSILALAAIHSV
jgi:hypothetical protein